MNVSIHDIPANVIARYEATAKARGVPLGVFLREQLIKNAPALVEAQSLGADQWEKALDDCFDSFVTSTGPLPDDAFDRENIYGREDKC